MTTPKPVMNSEVVNGGMKGPGGPMGLANRGGRGRGGGPRGGVSRFSGGPNDNINRNQQNQVRPQPNMNRPPPNINRGPIPNSNNRGGTTGPQQNGIINRPPQQQQNAVNRGPTLQNASTSRGPTLQNASTSRGPPPTRPPTVKSEEQKEVKSEQMENRGNPSQRGGNLGNRGGNRGFQRRDDNNPIRGGGGARNQDERLMEKVSAMGGPTYDLPPQEPVERKFSGHCRLYVGNLTNDITEDEVSALFAPFGQTAELFLNKEKNFAFIRLDYRASAEKAKRELDGSLRKGRQLKVRFAPHSAAVKVKNLTQFVSNELLEHAFSVFGEIERAYVLVDDRGKSMGEGIVEFARKPGAQLALRKCAENCFFLTSLGEYRDSCSRTLRPVIVESHEQLDDPDGYPEKNMFKKNPDFVKAREVGPRFATPDSFEHDYGTRWKQLYDLRKQKLDTVEREMKMEEEKLEAQMEFAKYEHETAMLREQLRQRELDRERQKREWEMKERQQEEQRRADEEMVRRQQEEMQLRMIRQEEDMRRRQQENSLFMQAQQLNTILDQQENAMRQGGGAGGYSPVPHDYDTPMPGDGYGMRGSGGPGNLPVDPKAFMDSYERGGAGSGGGMGGNQGRGGFDPIDDMGNRGGGMSRPRWGERRGGPMVDDYPSKRRRY